MARPRAADYDEKRLAILHKSAELFAERGFDRTSMNEIALALGVSKALFYHYYRAKEDLLFDIIRSHLLELVQAAEGADDRTSPRRIACGGSSTRSSTAIGMPTRSTRSRSATCRSCRRRGRPN